MLRTIPFCDAAPSEVCVRVAYQLIHRAYRKRPDLFQHSPLQAVAQLAIELDIIGLNTLSLHLAAFAYHGRQGMKMIEYRDFVVSRSRYAVATRREGRPWRLPPYPRVTNRGVQPSRSPEGQTQFTYSIGGEDSE